MTDYWKSNERHYCQICRCWMDAKSRSIRTHEEGRTHKQNLINHQRELREAKERESKEKNDLEKAWKEIEAKAAKSYEKDLAASGGTTGAAHPTPTAAPTAGPAAAPAAYPPPPPPIPATAPSPWQATIDPATGATYYYNTTTLETSWALPTLTAAETAAVGTSVKHESQPSGERKKQKHRPNGTAEAGDNEQQPAKKAKTEGAATTASDASSSSSSTSTSNLASAATTAAASTEPDIDEATGLGKWTSAEPQPTPSSTQPQQQKYRMTPFGRVRVREDGSTVPVDKHGRAIAASGSSSSSSSSFSVNISAPPRFTHFAGDDDVDALDDDTQGLIDMSEAVRGAATATAASTAAYGNSLLVARTSRAQEASTSAFGKTASDTLAGVGTGIGTAASEPQSGNVSFSFKKKRDRTANQRKPLAANQLNNQHT